MNLPARRYGHSCSCELVSAQQPRDSARGQFVEMQFQQALVNSRLDRRDSPIRFGLADNSAERKPGFLFLRLQDLPRGSAEQEALFLLATFAEEELLAFPLRAAFRRQFLGADLGIAQTEGGFLCRIARAQHDGLEFNSSQRNPHSGESARASLRRQDVRANV